MPPTEPFLAIVDVAELLNISPRQVRTLLTSGELRGIQIGGRGIWRIAPADLQAYIDRQYERTAPTTSSDDQDRVSGRAATPPTPPSAR